MQSYFAAYPLLKKKGCTECGKLGSCRKAIDIARTKLNCKEELAEDIILQMIPFERYEDLRRLASNNAEKIEEQISIKLLQKELDSVLAKLPQRHRDVLRMRFGLDGEEPLTLKEVGLRLKLTRERIRQIEEKALRRMRHLERTRKLKDFLD